MTLAVTHRSILRSFDDNSAFVANFIHSVVTMCSPAMVLKCRFCSFTSGTLRAYLNHQTIHRHVNRLFPCGVVNCSHVFPSETCLRAHLLRHHGLHCKNGTLYQPAAAISSSRDGMFECSLPICKKKFYSLKDLYKHLRLHLLSGIAIRCPFPACTNTFRNVNTFKSHMSREHRGRVGRVPLPLPVLVPFDPINLVSAEMTPEVIAPETIDTIEPIFFDDQSYQECLATFFMKLEFKCLIPSTTVQYIAREFQLLQEQSHNDLNSKLKKLLLEENITSDNLESVLLDAFSTQYKSQHNLRSAHMRKEYYKKNFIYVAPERISPPNSKTVFYYVSIAETLIAAFKDKSNKISLEPPVQLDPNILTDVTDGLAYKNNRFFQENPRSIRLILFQDGFEICSGYGRNKHKLTGVYMTIANIPPHIRTHVNSILLVALYKEKNFDHKSVYGKIVEDLKVLETDGVSIPEHGTVKAGLVYISGDNLGHHAVGGFNENFSRSIYFCRYCLIDRKSFHLNHHSQFPLRTPQSHGDCLRGAACNKKGVKFDSEFNKLSEFHVCNPGLASCCAHDLFEGVVAHDMVLFINYFVSEGWFTIPQLNAKIDNFKYDSADYRDKPNTFKEGCEKLSGGAMQIWCFLRLFPLFIKDFVDWNEMEDNLVWKALLLLSEIVELVMAPVIHVSVLPYLDAIIYEYLDLRVHTFPHVLLRPKHHYLTHYYFLLYFFGPMRLTRSMRFESKHSFFKRFARMLKNFRNILFSLSIKHELFMSYLRLGVEMRCDLKPTLSGEFSANIYSLDIQSALHDNLPPLLQECVSIVIKGTQYKKGSLLLVQQNHYQCDVEFGRIVLILYDSNTSVFFLVEVMEAEFMPLLRVYKLGARKMYKCVEQRALVSYSVVREYKIGTFTYVRLRTNVFCGNVNL